MVTLPSYVDQAGLSDGGNTLRLNHDSGAGVGVAAQRFGAHLTDAYLTGEKTDAIIAKVQEEEAKRAAGIDDALTRSEFVNSWQKKSAALDENIDPSGKNHVANVEAAFDAHVAEYEGRFSTTRGKENASLIADFRTRVVAGAIRYESTTRHKTLDGIAKADFENFKASTIEVGPAAVERTMAEAKIKADALNLPPNVHAAYMREARKNAELGALTFAIKTNPEAVIRAGDGLFAGLPAAGAPEEVKSAARGAIAGGADPTVVLAIGHVESKFDSKARPIGPDGKPMSSAKGVFQLLDGAYGLGKDADTEKQARAVALYLGGVKEKLNAAGVEPTPGKLYMFHNLGDGLATALLKARPDEKMGDIVARVYPSRPELAAQILRNNPSLYNANTTAAQAVAGYENKMAGGMSAVKSYVTEGGVAPTEDIAKARASELLGIPIEHIDPAMMKAATDQAKSDLSKVNKQDNALMLGYAAHEGHTRIDPFSETQVKNLNKFSETTGIQEGILRGDKRAFDAAVVVVTRNNVIPQPYENALRELVMSGNAKDPAKAQAYETLASIAMTNPVAWSASKLAGDIKGRVEKYIAMTKGSDSIVSPAEALLHITAEHTPDGDGRAKAARELWKDHKSAEIEALTLADVEKAVSGGLWRNAALFDPADPAAGVRGRTLLDNYRNAYRGYREQGKPPADAKIEALNDVKRSFGVSNVLRGTFERGEITKYPVEKYYLPVDAEKPFKWLEDQARALVETTLKTKGVLKDDQSDPALGRGSTVGERTEIRLVPTTRTANEVGAGKPPSYDLMYRNPKTGKIELAAEAWYPNQQDAQDAFDEKFLSAKRDRRDRAAEQKQQLVGAGADEYRKRQTGIGFK